MVEAENYKNCKRDGEAENTEKTEAEDAADRHGTSHATPHAAPRGTTVLIGMGAIESMDRAMWITPTDNVEVLVVSYPMEVDRFDVQALSYEVVKITDQADLEAWAEREYDHHDIRVL